MPQRAIIAINNWFEWVDEGGPKKQPHLIRRRDRAPILCAAIGQYPTAEHPPGEHDGFVIITADSAGGMVDIHDRRPVTLSPELAREWLDPDTPKDRAELMALQQGEPTEAFEWFKVDRAIGNVHNQGRELLKPKEEEHPSKIRFRQPGIVLRYFVISLFRYFVISSFRHFVISSFRHFVISLIHRCNNILPTSFRYSLDIQSCKLTRIKR